MRFIRQAERILPTDVEQELILLVEQLEAGQDELAKVNRQVGEKEAAYALARARVLLRSHARNAELREAEVLVALEVAFLDLSTLRTQRQVIRDRLHDLRAELDAVRSIGASVRSSMFSDGQSPSDSPQRGRR